MGSAIKLVVSDIDGTIVCRGHSLGPRAIAAARQLREAGIALSLSSSRPPRGMAMFVDPLEIEHPLSGFNGAMVVDPTMVPLRVAHLAGDAVLHVLETFATAGVETWVYRDGAWFVLDERTPHLVHNSRSVGFAPTVLPSFDDV
jgi:HAD superfamily hydrolase (TIGR01484 family)